MWYGFLLSLYYLGSVVLRGVCPSPGDSRISSESLSGCRRLRQSGKRLRRIVEALGLDGCCLEGAPIVEQDLLGPVRGYSPNFLPVAEGGSQKNVETSRGGLGYSRTRSSGGVPTCETGFSDVDSRPLLQVVLGLRGKTARLCGRAHAGEVGK
jgi:hypothetical protein